MSIAELVRKLYRVHGRWQAVADACNSNGTEHSAGYYQQIATGRIKHPADAVCKGIERAITSAETLLKCRLRRVPRGGLTIRRDLWEKLRRRRVERGLTWDELLEEVAG